MQSVPVPRLDPAGDGESQAHSTTDSPGKRTSKAPLTCTHDADELIPRKLLGLMDTKAPDSPHLVQFVRGGRRLGFAWGSDPSAKLLNSVAVILALAGQVPILGLYSRQPVNAATVRETNSCSARISDASFANT